MTGEVAATRRVVVAFHGAGTSGTAEKFSAGVLSRPAAGIGFTARTLKQYVEIVDASVYGRRSTPL
jgi:hypothetical protein